MKRRHALATMLLAVIPALVVSQDSAEEEVVQWQWTAAAAAAGIYDLRFTGRIASGYIVYGADFDVDIGPRPVRLKFDSPEVSPKSPLQSAGSRRRLDPVFKAEYSYFNGTVQLAQQVAVKDGVSRVTGIVRGQTCREADGTCALFSQRFAIDLP